MTAARRSTIIPASERLGLSRVEAAEYIGLSPSFFDALVADGRMPRPKRAGTRTIWDRRAIERAFSELPDGSYPPHAQGSVDPYADTAA